MHELSHVLVSMVFLSYLNDVVFRTHELGHWVVRLNIVGLRNHFSVICVAMSPILVPLTFLFLTMSVDGMFGLYFPYALMNWKTTLPSKSDFETAGFTAPKLVCFD